MQTYNETQLLPLRSRLRALAKYILKTDIARFYPSVYSHSIPWALHSKPVAKARRTDSRMLGNILDRHVRNAQDGQTIGIPIGPDSSLVIAEVILSAQDQLLHSLRSDLQAIRYVDDFEMGFGTYSAAEEALALLRATLKEYELEINPQKTEIIELPIPLTPTWVAELRNYKFRPSARGQQSDLRAYFDRAFELAAQNTTSHILKYAIARLHSVEIHESNWEITESFLLQCLMVETNTFYSVVGALRAAQESGKTLNLDDLHAVMNYQIIQQCPINHGNEVAWAVWALMYWSLTITTEAAHALSKINDSAVALVTLDAHQRGLIPMGLDTSLWETYLTQDDLYGSHWLLAYEANVKCWLPSSADYVAADPNFGFLKTNGIEFYDTSRATNVSMTGVANTNLAIPLFSF